MEHILAVLIEPVIGLFTICTEVVGICVDGCLQTCRESCHCIGCNSSTCSSRGYDDEDEESRPILSRSQPSPHAQPDANGTSQEQPTKQRWSSVDTLRGS